MSAIPESVVPIPEGGPERLYQLIQYFREHCADESNLNQAIRSLECLIFIHQNKAFIRYAILNKTDPAIYKNPEDRAKQALRDHNGMSFHIVSYSDPDRAWTDYSAWISGLEINVPRLLENEPYARIFIRKIKDSDVGCLEARLADAMLFLSAPEVLRLHDLFSAFYVRYAEVVQTLPFLQALIAHFSPYLGEQVMDAKEVLILLSWEVVKAYLKDIMMMDDIEERIKEHTVDILNQGLKPVWVEHKHPWLFYHYDSRHEAQIGRGLAQLFLAETHANIKSAQVSSSATGHSFKLTWPQHFALAALQQSPLERARVPPRLMKALRWDSLCFYRSFIESITHAAAKDQEPRADLRLGSRKPYTVFGTTIYQRGQKPPRLSVLAHEHFLSRPQSTTLITLENQFLPFKFENHVVGLAFLFDLARSSWSRLIKDDTGTLYRPYDFNTKALAEAYLVKMQGKLFSDIESFMQALRTNVTYNEVLARLYFDLQSSCIAVTMDNFSSRCAAQFLAQETLRALGCRYERTVGYGRPEPSFEVPPDYTVPIIYYLPGNAKNFQTYLLEDQIVDRLKANRLIGDEDPTERNVYFAVGDFSFLLLADNPRDILSLEWEGRPILLAILRKGLVQVAEAVLERAGSSEDAASYLQQYARAGGPSLYSATDGVLFAANRGKNTAELAKAFIQCGASVNVCNASRQALLHVAILHRWGLDAIQILLGVPGIINVNCNGAMALNLALDCQYFEIALALLNVEGIDVTMPDHLGGTPLHRAVIADRLDIVQALLRKGAIQSPFYDGSSLLLAVAEKGSAAMMLALLEQDSSSINQANRYGKTPLLAAVYRNCVDMVRILLARSGIDINKASESGMSPLSAAAELGYEAIVSILLERPEIELNQVSRDGMTPLKRAVRYDRLTTVRALLSKSELEVNERGVDGVTALYTAACCGHTDICLALLERPDINVNQSRNNGLTPLHIAIDHGYSEIVLALLARPDIDINTSTKEGHLTPLYTTVLINRFDFFEALLSKAEIQVNTAYEDEATVLVSAAMWGRLKFVEALLKRPDIEVNKAAVREMTALHSAVVRGHFEVVQMLVGRSDLDLNKATTGKGTALSSAVISDRIDIVKVLLTRSEIDVNQTVLCNVTVLCLAVEAGQRAIVRALLEHPKIDVNKAGIQGMTPLHCAIHHNNLEMVQVLLDRPDIDLDRVDSKKRETPLSKASAMGNIEFARLINEKAYEHYLAASFDKDHCYRVSHSPFSFQNKREYTGKRKSLLDYFEV